jgi:hypothetical protein
VFDITQTPMVAVHEHDLRTGGWVPRKELYAVAEERAFWESRAVALSADLADLVAALPRCDWGEKCFGDADPTCTRPATKEVDNSHYHYFACDEHADKEFYDLDWGPVLRKASP